MEVMGQDITVRSLCEFKEEESYISVKHESLRKVVRVCQ
jgi:hypothetical protein